MGQDEINRGWSGSDKIGDKVDSQDEIGEGWDGQDEIGRDGDGWDEIGGNRNQDEIGGDQDEIFRAASDQGEFSGDDDDEANSVDFEFGGFLSFPEDDSQLLVADGEDDSQLSVGGEDDLEDSESDDVDSEDDSMGNESDDLEDVCLPDTLIQLRKLLLGEYSLPLVPPNSVSGPKILSASEKYSLKHYVAWKSSNGTVKAYKLHAQVLQEAADVEILSLHNVQKLAIALTDFLPIKVDICPQSCIAYTGEYENMTSCPHVRDGKMCGQQRYKERKKQFAPNKPRAQMMHLPVMATIKAMFANEETSGLLRHRDKCLQQALHIMATASGAHKYSDFADSKVHMHHYQSMDLFQDSRDIAFAISTDGAQLTMKKQSDTWLLIFILLNLPAEIRYQVKNYTVAFSTPGPNPPGNMESFLYPVFEQMAIASEGIWTWDAVDSSYFVNRAHICMALGDMLGSAKLNGMAGHAAVYGDRFSMVKGARASNNKGAKAQYYPLSPPETSIYNPDRPESYDLDNLPMREEDFYWKTICALQTASSKTAANALTKKTGISRLPLCAASPAFVHPSFFPLDPFHLLYENCQAFMWDLWTIFSSPSEIIHLSADMACQFGQMVSEAMLTLPAAFCGPVRDPFLKRQSQYKIYEWMALLHWYILPIGIELGLNYEVLENYSHFVEAVEFAMTISPRSEEDLANLHNMIKKFLQGFERLYIGKDPQKVSRFRLCIFQLIHIPIHIEWNGSIRLGSQATVERAIGEMSHKICSKKAPFANLANIIYERELIKILLLHYPSLGPSKPKQSTNTIKPFQQIKITQRERASSQTLSEHLLVICNWIGKEHDSLEVKRYGKVNLGKNVLRSQLSESQGVPPTRSACHFEAQVKGTSKPIFGEALAFFEVLETKMLVVVYHPIINLSFIFGKWRGHRSQSIEVLPVSEICDIVGIWNWRHRVYILRKHPGLQYLNAEEAEKISDNCEDEE